MYVILFIDGRPHFAKRSIDDGKKVKIALSAPATPIRRRGRPPSVSPFPRA
jgi:hypothetical protein